MKTNYHTHTKRCMHARGEDEEYVISAIKAGFDVLGFSDHCPWNYKSDFVANMRMPMREFPGYIESMRYLRDKYKDQIQILIGLECEYFEEYMDDLKKLIADYELDYVILGNHYYKSDEYGSYFGFCANHEMIKEYVEETIKGMESGVFAYLAHPDLFMGNWPEFDETCAWAAHEICKKAEELDMILEYNLGGVRYSMGGRKCGYPCDEFWKIASTYNIKAIVGVDAHDNKNLEDEETFNKAIKYLEDLGLEVVNEIPLRSYQYETNSND